MKRKSLLFALFLAVFTPQVANAQCYYALPYNYGFEEEEQFNNCWTVISGTVTRRTDHPNTGNYNLDFRGTTSNMIVMNTIFSRPTDQLRVKFHTRPESIYGRSGKFAVGYMTDIDDASTFVAVETFNSTEMTTDYVQKKVDMYNVRADSRIAMRQFDCEDNYYWFVDDVIVEQMPYCLAPVNLAANVTSTSAELSWVDRNGESVWTVYYKKAEEENYTEVANATNPCTLTGLAVDTKYQYYVKADCGSNYELSEPSVVFSFRTLCGAITIDETPWTENFEVFNYETLAAGWNDPKAFMMNDGCWDVNYGEYVNPALYTNYKRAAFSGSTSVQFSNEKGSATLILPEFANELNTLQFEFKACVDQLDNEGTMEVGYWYNDEFTAIHSGIQTQTARGANDDTNASGDYMGPYPLNGTIPSGSRMALHYTANSTLRSCINIDDFRVSLIPSCIKPINLVASNITTNAVTLSWTENGTATSWQICLNDDDNNLIDADSNPFTLEQDFNAATLYTVKVRSYCNEDEQSDWSNALSFETPCGTITVTDSWSENFNRLTSGIPSCWDNSDGTTTNESYRWNYYATGHEGAGLRFNSYTNSNGNTNFLKTPAIKLPADKLMQLTFWYKNPTGGDFSVYISTDGGNTYTTALATGLTGVTSWTEHPAIDLSSYFDQEVVIVFKGTSNYGDGDAYIYLDDITITENPTCPVPSALRVTDKTTTSVTFSWTNGAENQTAWQICLNGDEENLIMANSNPFTLEGLSVSTTYTAKIRTYCSENYQSDWSSELSFGTECGVITSFPWCEDFNRLIVGASIPFCWDRSEGETNFYWSYDGSTNGIGACNGTSHDGSKCISFNSFGNYDGATNSLKTPVLNLPDSPILLSFWYKNPAGGDLSVFISTDGGATYPTALFTGLIDQPTWEQKTYDLTSYAGQENVVIVFKATSNDGHNDAFIYLDDVSIMENPNCPTPTDLEVTATTATTATFSWTNGAKYQTKWQICLNDDEENLIMANSNPFTVEGLTVSTSYTAKVRTYCSENYQSDWSNEVSFQAECKDVIGLAVVENSLTTRSVTMQWDAEVDDVFDYAIELGANIDPETVTYAESITATETTCSMTWDDLIPNSDYTVFIRRNCGNGAVGQPATMTIHTEIACFAPTNLTASANYKTATVAWEGDADSYEIAWSVDSNADPDQNIDPDFQISGTTGSKEFTTIDTRYYFWVRANCGDEGYSNWEGPVDTYIGYCRPNCWSMNGNGITNLVYTGTNTVTNTTHPYAYPYYGYYIDQICEIKTDETATLDITYETGYGYKTYIWVDLDNSLSFEDSEILYTGESENSWSSTLNASITLPPTTVPGDYRMRIGGADDGMNNGGIPCYNDRYAVFEDYTLRVIEVTCPRPTDLTTTNLTTNSTTLNWESDAESFEVQYRVPYAEWNFFEGFENGLPSNWSTINGDQANDWWLTLNSASYAHSGSGCMFSNSGYDPDEWLISPQVQLHGTLKFYASNGGFQQGSEHFAVYVSTKSKAVQDFVMVGDERIIDNAQGYNEITIDINQYHGAMGYVAIRHFNSSGSMLILDDFSISYLQEEGPWIDATSGTNSLNITDLTPNTEYEFHVKAECDDDDTSDWSSSAFFTTPDSYSAPYY
ncbi:MAG: choice-of-anchor J domain-containing protein, partial [Bacteroidales bacterium]|nr:choice-of-anchor J domain-containing protein [Bacteroidales bacterium]